jgi:hypothetical protein
VRTLAAGVAVLLGVVAAVALLWPTAAGPVALRYGVDTCAECRMHVSRPGFGGELRDAEGRLTTYDDIGCLVRAMMKQRRAMPGAWVEDRDGRGFVPLAGAHLVRSPGADTPMGGGVVGFADEAAARAFATATGGALVGLEDVVRGAERSARPEETR